MGFIVLRYTISIPILMRVFIMNKFFFPILFLHLLRSSYDFCPLVFLTWCMTLTNLQILNHPCVSGINPTWSWCTSQFIYFWIRFTKFYWGFLSLHSSEILAYNFIYLWFWYQGNGWCWIIYKVGGISTSSIWGNNLIININSSLCVWICPVNLSCPGLLFAGRFCFFLKLQI